MLYRLFVISCKVHESGLLFYVFVDHPLATISPNDDEEADDGVELFTSDCSSKTVDVNEFLLEGSQNERKANTLGANRWYNNLVSSLHAR